MIKPKYPKRADLSQIARSAVENAIGSALTPVGKKAKLIPPERNNHHRKERKTAPKAD